MPESLKPPRRLRPSDLARRHGISAQAVRNYEQDGCLPAADRTPAGYRVYTGLHELALAAYLALIGGHGHATAGVIMRAVNDGDLDAALQTIDESHVRLHRDRQTLDAVRAAVGVLAAEWADGPEMSRGGAEPTRGIGAVARRLGVTSATLRAWERAGILTPLRDPATGYRSYDADDLRDAELARLLRRGGERLDRIAVVLGQVRDAGSIDALAGSQVEWRARLNRRGVAMIEAGRRLADYLDQLDRVVETDIETQH